MLPFEWFKGPDDKHTIIGADIIMALDDVVKTTITSPRIEEAMYRTLRWLDRCIAEFLNVERDTLEDEILSVLDVVSSFALLRDYGDEIEVGSRKRRMAKYKLPWRTNTEVTKEMSQILKWKRNHVASMR
ncbi:Queuine tRNA-ribosyltransferase [Capsicum baccatum]|uniref:Queuine tRNA-ribosyltransferase n=1 Tax=Capsicum baccatum TaxID=33114 RepID=A0A2G2VTC4_CAPBA|nr:Queuine tRNA-ribosyltransferase [Capsicum baccatum]